MTGSIPEDNPLYAERMKMLDKLSHGQKVAPLAVALGPGLNRLCAALVLTGLYGAGLEVVQMVGDAGREGSLLDIAANLSGALAGLIVVAILRGDRPLFRGDNF
jgi:VanZ family protein